MTKIKAKYYIGLMSGTSADGIDLALVDFQNPNVQPKLIASYYHAYDADIAEKITALYCPKSNEIDRAFELDVELAYYFSHAITQLLAQENLSDEDIIAIGSHGQTIRHRPSVRYPFTLQIGCGQTLACLTNIRVVGQFRVKDMALGGQGAPLVPAFHRQIFTQKTTDVFVVNIGGIANISFLPAQTPSQEIMGFDTGPGNALLDDWFNVHHANSEVNYDDNGAWAKQGRVNQLLLQQLLNDDYFRLTAPKSTGREYFHLTWLTAQLEQYCQKEGHMLPAQDVQATLTALTAFSIAQDIKRLAKHGQVYLGGGGAHNQQLVNEIKQQLTGEHLNCHFEVLLTSAQGIEGDVLEAIAFAWLAFAYDNRLLSNIPTVTGANRACTLGIAFFP